MATPIEIACREKYGIDFTEKITQILPYFWSETIGEDTGKEVFLAYMNSLFSQLPLINEELISFCSEIELRLSYTGQVMSLEKLLNDSYDDITQRCFIECFTVAFASGIFVYLDSEEEDTEDVIYLDGEVNPGSNYFFLDSEDSGQLEDDIVNFTVHVPSYIDKTDDEIINLLDIYVVAGQTYNINRF